MSERTHMDLKLGVPYIHPGNVELIYMVKRLVKSESSNFKGSQFDLPQQLATVCSPQCALLKGKDTCPTHHTQLTLPAYGGETASMLSYLTARVGPYITSKTEPTVWSVTMAQVTSRSISHVIDVERAVTWDNASADDKNIVIKTFKNQMWDVLARPDSQSAQLKAVAQNAQIRAEKLFKQLLVELGQKYTNARWTADSLIRFENPQTFLAGLTGANSQYSSYASHSPAQLAMLHELALKEGRKTNPELVKDIMGCYAKVREAEKYEAKPYIWDPKIVEKVMLSGLFKPDPTEVQLPF